MLIMLLGDCKMFCDNSVPGARFSKDHKIYHMTIIRLPELYRKLSI